jgi:sialate O-acetylesterase
MGWHKIAEPNLMNSVGLPASPFSAGEPPKLDTVSLNVPESAGYELVYEMDLNKVAHEITYDTDNSSKLAGPFDRVAYFVELGDSADGEHRWVYVSMDAFTDDLSKVGVPAFNSGASFQRGVNNVVVYTNVPGVPNAEGRRGNIEFWPNNYGKANTAKVAGATDQFYDTGDQISSKDDGYGSMQVHLADPSVTLFAINNWKSTTPDIGIGTNTTGGEPDWTFTGSGKLYPFKQLKVYVRPADR